MDDTRKCAILFSRWIMILVALLFAFPAIGNEKGTSLPTGVSPDWWSTVKENIEKEEYFIVPPDPMQSSGNSVLYAGSNPSHGFQTQFMENEIQITPVANVATWQWGLQLRSVDSVIKDATAKIQIDKNRIEYQRDGIHEWFINSSEGLEHGFLIFKPLGNSANLNLDMSLTGTLHPKFSEDGQSIDFYDRGNFNAIHYAKLKVTDARGDKLSSRFEAIPGGIRIVIDDSNTIYPILIDPLATSPAWIGSGDENRAHYGYSVATAGDVNGDGYSDIIVGAYEHDAGFGPNADRGRAYVYLGSPSGLSTSASWTRSGDQNIAWFGYSVATAGDVNGDGYSDIIVSARRHSAGGGPISNRGRAYLYLGSPYGLSNTAAWTGSGDVDFARFGHSVGTAGDVNGDGYSDVIVGAPEHATGGSYGGRAYVYFGSAAGLATIAAWTGSGDENGAYFGGSVAIAGDTNGDGYSDIMVGATYHDAGAGNDANRGRAYVFLGAPSGPLTTAAWIGSGDENKAYFGMSVATAGDINGDGYSDIIVGASHHNAGGSGLNPDRGRAYVYLGSSSGPATIAAWVGSGDDSSNFGNSVATAGDPNGDGYSDIIVGAKFHSPDIYGTYGRAYVYFGSSSGLTLTPAWTGSGDEDDAYFGESVSPAGDINGDGFSDIIIGASSHDAGAGTNANRGRAYVYLGSPSGPAANAEWISSGEENQAQFGYSLASAGDVNGDGYSDTIVGAYWQSVNGVFTGRTYVYFGSASGIAVIPAWSASGEQLKSQFGFSVATAGDVNGDGYSDVIVGANLYDAGSGEEHGRAYVYLGSPSGPATTAAWTASGDESKALFGNSVATAGDVNGDGYSDVIVGAYLHNAGAGFVDRGRAYVYSGSASGLALTPVFITSGEQNGANVGYSVGTARDVNRDGYSDIIVGAPGTNSNRGRAYVYFGSAAGLDPKNYWSRTESELGAYFGYSVASSGDVNGDGFSDIAVGAYRHDAGAGSNADRGRVYVYHGSASGPASSATWTGSGDENGGRFGNSVASSGDVNGDGYSDLIVGAYRHDAGAGTNADQGRAYIYFGSPSGLSTTANWTTSGDENGAFFGTSVASSFDVNADGYSDVIVGVSGHDAGAGANANRGRAYLYYGNEGDSISMRPRQFQGEAPNPIAPLGLVYHLQSRIGLTLRTPFGRGKVSMEWQVLPLGSTFNPLVNPIQQTTNWWNSTVSGIFQTTPVELDSPASSGPWIWRIRARYAPSTSPFQTHGPWFALPDNGIYETDFISLRE